MFGIKRLEKKILEVEKRIKQLECNHEEEYVYFGVNLNNKYDYYYEVRCKKCGKEFGIISKEEKLKRELKEIKKRKKELEIDLTSISKKR